MEEERRCGNRTTWLGQQPRLEQQSFHCRANLVFRDCHNVVYVPINVVEWNLAYRISAEPVGDRPSNLLRIEGDDLSCLEACLRIGGELRFHSHDLDIRLARL